MANRAAAACIVATLAFWAYTQTLVPGVDLGDTGGFQAAVLWPAVSARQAYPLYYNVASRFVVATCGSRLQPRANCDPARALNLFSALSAALAVGLLTFLAATLTESIAGGIVAGLLLAFSYTFWSQAIIAEVYALHLALVGACFIALCYYARKPTARRLALFFALYAVSFGNHLSMILLFVPFAVFLLQTTPDRRTLFRPGIVGLALVTAVAGALQYLPNLLSVMTDADPPAAWSDRIAAFWFDTTKADWRESMVFGVQANRTLDRFAMWWFDARQQFGIAGLALAIGGALRLWTLSRPWFTLVVTAFGITTLFALTYNVGDSHVFFMPAHFLAALCAGVAIGAREPDEPVNKPVNSQLRGPHGAHLHPTAHACAAGTPDLRRGVELPTPNSQPGLRGTGILGAGRLGVDRHRVRIAFACLAILYGGWRGWSTWPAVDRHDDRRGEQLITRLTLGVRDPEVLFVSKMNWELENVLLYMARHHRPDLTWTRLGDVLPHFPFLVEDQREISREIVLTADAAADVFSAYGPLVPLIEDTALPVAPLAMEVARIPTGMPYVLTVLTPPPEERLDEDDFTAALAGLTRNRPPVRSSGAFELIAGLTGERPSVYRVSNRPFTMSFRLLDEPFTVRMDSWLPFDTFRRPGFGHVLRGREHVQILERGVNLVWLGRDGRAASPVYAASLFAPKPRYRIVLPVPVELARSLPAEPDAQLTCGFRLEAEGTTVVASAFRRKELLSCDFRLQAEGR